MRLGRLQFRRVDAGAGIWSGATSEGRFVYVGVGRWVLEVAWLSDAGVRVASDG